MSFLPLRRTARLLIAFLPALLAACGGGGGGADTSVAAPVQVQPAPAPTQAQGIVPAFSPSAALGQQIYHDASLSASSRQSCATCHNPDNAHGPVNDLAVQLGGPNGDVPGFRASPSLRYMHATPAFHFEDGTPTGGFDRDGRARTLSDQSERPFLAPHEMANTSKAAVVARLKNAAYAAEFRKVFGAGVFDSVDEAFNRIQFALQQFENEDPRFHPYDSKYDQFLAGKAKLTDAEMRGLALFNNPAKANCAACHPSARASDGSAPLFTDFSYDNLGVPRNKLIPATADPTYFDLGLCGPDRTDLAARTDLCGAFKVPTLRNVATRKTFFHNGAFNNLLDVVRFYVTRDTDPARWYPTGPDGVVDKFNDLPPAYRKNVNTTEVPYNRGPGMAPALNEAEIADLVQFLGTLNDGYKP
jgi:cytochrome c peroxidase